MKRFLLYFFFLFCLIQTAFSQTKPIFNAINIAQQNNRVFEKIQALRALATPHYGETDDVKKAQYFKLDHTVTKYLRQTKPSLIEFSIPQSDGQEDMVLLLQEQSIFSPDFKLVDSNREATVSYTEGAYYRGIVQGQPNSLVAFSFFDEEIIGVISTEQGKAVLGKISNHESANHILYWEKDAKFALSFLCGSEDTPFSPTERAALAGGNTTESNHCVRMYLELEQDLVLEKGGLMPAADFMTGVFNVVSALYAQEGVNMIISEIYAWTSPDGYPTNASVDALYAFQTKRGNYQGDLAHLVSRGAPVGGGVAFVNGLCSTYGYGYSYIYGNYNHLPTYSWTVSVLTHEIGHNLGSRHTHACVWNGNSTAIDGCGQAAGYSEGCNGPIPATGGTIMSYCHLVDGVGIDFSKGFGPQPRALILANIEKSACLNACNGGPSTPVCTVVANAQAADISCAGQKNGTVTTTVSGGQVPYTFLWSNAATQNTITGLSAQTYSVTATDKVGCTAIASAIVKEPSAIQLTTQEIGNSFSGANDGAISLQISGGKAPYSVLWSNGVRMQNQSNLVEGIYSVTVTDANTCFVVAAVELIARSRCQNTVSSFPFEENFESSNLSFEQMTDDDFDWAYRSGRTPSNYTGPDDAFQGAQYLYVEASGNYNKTASLLSPCIDLKGRVQARLTFKYNMLGAQMGTLSVEVQASNGLSAQLWAVSGDQGSDWKTATIDLSNYENETIRLLIRGIVGDGYRSDIAVDAISVLSEPIPCDAPVFGLVGQDVPCAGEATGRIFLSQVLGGQAPYNLLWSTGATGEVVSDLKAGFYALKMTDATGCSSEKTILLSEPSPLVLSLENTFASDAQKNDAHISSLVQGGTPPYIYEWSTGAETTGLTAVGLGDYALTVVDANGCITENSIKVTAKPALTCNPMVAYPHSQGFENGFEMWSQGDTDDMDWTLNSGSTSTNWTGPWSAIEGSTYAYLEASGNRNKQADLISPCLTLAGAGTPLLNFNYHMYGSQMGSLMVQVSTDGGVTWSENLWSIYGNQGNAWFPATVDLSAYRNQIIRVRFKGKINKTRSDMAIDQIRISNDGSTNPIGPEGALFVDFDNLSINPNPVVDVAHVRFESRSEIPYTLAIYDLAGRLIKEQKGVSLIGYSNIELEMSQFGSGLYLVVLQTNSINLKTMVSKL